MEGEGGERWEGRERGEGRRRREREGGGGARVWRGREREGRASQINTYYLPNSLTYIELTVGWVGSTPVQ